MAGGRFAGVMMALVLGVVAVVAAGGNAKRVMLQDAVNVESPPLECPPPGFDSVGKLNLTQYIAAPWYIQQQMVVAYQPKDSLYCVRASYELVDPKDIKEGIIVENYANVGRVNGEPIGTSGSGQEGSFSLRATVPDLNDASKLRVGPGFLERLLGKRLATFFFGDYWVVAVGESDDPEIGYDWAIVSGGAPGRKGENGCKTGSALLARLDLNGAGLWLFSRKPVDPENTKIMRETAKDLGYDLSVLEDVKQEGCKYEGALQEMD